MTERAIFLGRHCGRPIKFVDHRQTNVIRLYLDESAATVLAISLSKHSVRAELREKRRNVLRRITSHPIANGNGTDVVSAIWGEPGVAVPLHTRMAMKGRLARIAEGGAT